MTRGLRFLGGLLAVAALVPAGTQAAKRDQSFALGEGRVTARAPATGYAFACAAPAAGPSAQPLPWTAGGSWIPARRPVVDGSVAWPAASFELDRAGSKTDFLGNGLPLATPTGVFPPPGLDDAAPFGDGAAAIAEQDVRGTFVERRAEPPRGRPACIDPALPVAIATNGVPILTPFDAAGLDLFAREVTDRCGGRTDAAGLYRYRGASPCLGRRASGRAHSGLVGWARDGFPLHGPRGPRGAPLRSADLDACHGHRHRVSLGGPKLDAYHYHATPDFPYAMGCFRGRPATGWRITARPTGPRDDAPAPQDGAPAPPGDAPAAQDGTTSPQPDPPPTLDRATLTATPALFPAFDVDVTDYVVRCGGDPVAVTADAPAGLTVAIDGGPAMSGAQTVGVDLDPGQGFRLTVANSETSRTFHVRCLPADFPNWSVERLGEPAAEWYFAAPSFKFSGAVNPYVILYDDRGVPVWWRDTSGDPVDAKLLPNGNVAWYRNQSSPFGIYQSNAYEERGLDGSLVRTLETVGSPTDLHDLQLMPNGNYLMLTYRARDGVDLTPYGGPANATVLDAEVQEIAPDGGLVWVWNAKDHLSLDETERWWQAVLDGPTPMPGGGVAYDHHHINSVELDGDGIVISLRHTDAIYRIDRVSGAVDWKLGGTTTPASLTFVGDALGLSSFGGQHDPRVLPDGTVTVYDNGTERNRPPRAVRYAIDPVARTAMLLEEVRDPAVTGSFCCGSARRLSGGWVVYWGANPLFTELSADGEVVLRLTWDGVLTYRTNPVEPGVLSASDLRAGMEAQHPR